jgi:DNA (cytosine-5)-methyltransferase 1
MANITLPELGVAEICAGAGGQSLGLHKAGFEHVVAVELDATAAKTLRDNIPTDVRVGDVADENVWTPKDYEGVTLLAGGVPCPPFSVAGRQLGSSDERDLFAWAVEQAGVIHPRVLLLENVRGLSAPRFSAYRQRVLDRLDTWGYVGEWKLIFASDFGVPQLRPRFVLVAMSHDDHRHFHWPEPTVTVPATIGDSLHDLMAADGWRFADEWRLLAQNVGPTLVGGSKKHGGADLGPTRAKEAWKRLYVDGRGVADKAPSRDALSALEAMPRLTVEMASRVQGWSREDGWRFSGGKTSQYRQVGNAFPPPVAEALGRSIATALSREAPARDIAAASPDLHDPVYRALVSSDRPLSIAELLRAQNEGGLGLVERKLAAIRHDFTVETTVGSDGVERYRLGEFKGFVGQQDHARQQYLAAFRNRVS